MEELGQETRQKRKEKKEKKEREKQSIVVGICYICRVGLENCEC